MTTSLSWIRLAIVVSIVFVAFIAVESASVPDGRRHGVRRPTTATPVVRRASGRSGVPAPVPAPSHDAGARPQRWRPIHHLIQSLHHILIDNQYCISLRLFRRALIQIRLGLIDACMVMYLILYRPRITLPFTAATLTITPLDVAIYVVLRNGTMTVDHALIRGLMPISSRLDRIDALIRAPILRFGLGTRTGWRLILFRIHSGFFNDLIVAGNYFFYQADTYDERLQFAKTAFLASFPVLGIPIWRLTAHLSIDLQIIAWIMTIIWFLFSAWAVLSRHDHSHS